MAFRPPIPLQVVNDKKTVAAAGNQMKNRSTTSGMPIIKARTTTSRLERVRTPRRRRLGAAGEGFNAVVAETISS